MLPAPCRKTLSPSRSLPSPCLPPYNKPVSTAPPHIPIPAHLDQPFERSAVSLPSRIPFLSPDRTAAISELLPATALARASSAQHRQVPAAAPLPQPESICPKTQ